MKNTTLVLLAILISMLLWWKWPQIRAAITPDVEQSYVTPAGATGTTYEKAYFAAGCFWCAESSFESYPGVVETISGYAGGTEVDPTYEQVGRQETSHREAVEVIYDPSRITYSDLLQIFWRTANPTDDGGQYVDRGFQYTSAIWYQSEEEKTQAESSKNTLEASGRFGSEKLVTPILVFTTFYPAEKYHQDYYKVSSLHYQIYTNGSGRKQFLEKIWGENLRYEIPQRGGEMQSSQSIPTKEELKKILTPIQYSVTQEGDTERPFSNEYDKNYSDGIYVDIVSGIPLYSSRDKFDSGTGWPSFTRPIEVGAISLHEDNTFFSTRTEVRGALSDAHIGHVFDDGPVDKGGKRYCMNSAALRFVPLADMESAGYGEWISQVQ